MKKLSSSLVFIFFVTCFYLAYGDHTENQKHYCWECLMTNGSKCIESYSKKVRCPDLDKFWMPFYCFEREHNDTGTLTSERGCIRKDFYEAGYLCFEDLYQCSSKVCYEHMCNASNHLTASVAILFCIVFAVLMLMWI